jgi:putative chitinase
MIDVATLIAAGIAPTQAAQFAEPLAAACARFSIDTPLRQAAFVAECAEESRHFADLVEGLFYRDPSRIHAVFGRHAGDLEDCAHLACNPQLLANTVYAGRMGNGDAASGDGWRFRGSGLIQLTGRDNQTRCAQALGVDLEGFGDYLRTPEGAAMSAAWFWFDRGINTCADRQDIDGCTRLINPAMEGYIERRETYRIALAAFTGAARTAQAGTTS